MFYIHFCLLLKQRIPDLVQNYWGVVHSLHPLLVFFWIHTFCMEILKYSKEYDFSKRIEVFTTVMAYFNMVINCVLAVYFSMISVTYKTKDVLSSKTNILETKSVLFKIIIPILWATNEKSEMIQTFVLVLSLINGILHDWIFIKYLPYYKMRTLLLSAVLQAFQTSLALVSYIIKIIETKRSKSNDIGMFSVQIIWLLTAPILAKLYYTFTWKVLHYIFTCEIKNEKNIYYLVHKRYILFYFLKSRKIINGGVNTLTFADIMYQAKLAEIILKSTELSFEGLNINRTLLKRSLKIIYVETLHLHPKAILAEINLADLYSNFEEMFIVSNNLLEDAFSKRPGYNAQISAHRIRFELQRKIKFQSAEKMGEGLNTYNYELNQEIHEQIKGHIQTQTDMQIKFWKEFLSNKPNLMNLANIAFQVKIQRQIVKRLWSQFLKIRAASFLSPLEVYGMYSSLINNDSVEGEKYLEQSREDTKRMKSHLKADELSNETMFSDKTIRITMSGIRTKIGKIIDCSSNITNFYRWQSSDLKGSPIVTLMSPFYRHRHDSFLLNHLNTGKIHILNNTRVVPVKRSNGYIHPSWIHIKLSPLMENGMIYVGLIRPCKPSQRMLLIRKDGKIDDMSLEFARDMNLKGKENQIECDIFNLCPEFRQINEAFNIIAENTINDCMKKNDNDDDISPLFTAAKKRFSQLTQENFITSIETTRITERLLLGGNRRYTKIETGRLRSDADEETPMFYRFNEKSALPKMEINKAQFIYEQYMTGSTLRFYPRKNNQPNYFNPLLYKIKVMNSIHVKEVIKYILLEKLEGNTEEDLHSAKSSPQEDTYFSPKILTNKSLKIEEMTSTRIKPEFTLSNETHPSILDEFQNDNSPSKKPMSPSILKDPFQSALLSEQSQVSPMPERRKSKFLGQKIAEDQKKLQNKPKQKQKLRKIEMSVASSYTSKGKKIEQLIVIALKDEPKKKSATIFICLLTVFLISMLVLLAVQDINLHSGIHEVQLQIPVINAGYFRQYNMISSASVARQWKGALHGNFTIDWEEENRAFQSSLRYYASETTKYNAEFYQLLAKLPPEMQTKFYLKNVEMNDFDEGGNKTLIGIYSTFEAFQMIIEKQSACVSTDIPSNFTPHIDTSNFQFLIDNSLNDLLIQSQKQIDQLISDLKDSTDSTTLSMGLTLGGVLLACLIFGIISFRYFLQIASETKIFMVMVFRIKPQECKNIQSNLQNFAFALDIDTKNQDLFMPKKGEMLEESQNNNAAAGATRFRRASMSSFYKSLRIAFLKLLPIYSVFICWNIIFFFVGSDFIGNIKGSENRMEVALQALTDQALYVYETTSVFLTNGTALVKNGLLVPLYLKDLHNLGQLDSFADKLRDRKGQLTALQEKILFGFPCENFLPILAESPQSYEDYIDAYEGCLNLTKGKDSIGLVNIYSELYNTGLLLYEFYSNSNKTKEELGDLFLLQVQLTFDPINTAEGFLTLLHQATYENFENDVDKIPANTLYFTISIIVGTLIVSVITWYFAMKKILKTQKIDWFILQLIPIQMILGNKHIQQYLLKHSDGMLNGVKSF